MNRLSESNSLYLRQHAEQPVDWQPWDEAALKEARSSGKPILLSIGYSACHWCHVMAHESFDDPHIAQCMNALFVNIKVDREERPDLDRIYQLSQQVLSGRGGGWPLTVFLDPEDLTPFFAGTYFPPVARHGLPSFGELIKKVRAWYDTHREDIQSQSQRLAEAITSIQPSSASGPEPGIECIDPLPSKLEKNFDSIHTGFGGGPKFPQAPLLALLEVLSEDARSEISEPAGRMLEATLVGMAMSGLRDHLDGGFFRYCVDDSWTIPHFEKMLYDNAQLLPLYARAAARSDRRFLRDVSAGIVDWLCTSMRDENGAFAASIDADADGHEGGFHVWQREELEAVLDQDEAERVVNLFGLDRPPNFEAQSWHLVRADDQPESDLPAAALEKLLMARQGRIPPTTDQKRIASWNALCIEGLVRAGLALQREDWIEIAESAFEFIHREMWRENQLYSVHAGGKAQFPAYLDDYAALLSATLALLECRWTPQRFAFATKLADSLLDDFGDDSGAGFFFTRRGAEAPVQRLKPIQDDALPAGNGLAALALMKLGHLSGESRYLEATRRTLHMVQGEMRNYPLAHAALLQALHRQILPPAQVIVIGQSPEDIRALTAEIRALTHDGARVHCYSIDPGDQTLPGILGNLPHRGAASAHVCRGLTCLPPVTDATAVAELLREEA